MRKLTRDEAQTGKSPVQLGHGIQIRVVKVEALGVEGSQV